MDYGRLFDALRGGLPEELARDLVENFATMAYDAATGTLGRAAPGKFVETVVQALQYLENGKFDPEPKVDEYLRGLESRLSPLDDGLRLCTARIARAMYTLRNKRGIAHKGALDPSRYDLRFLYAASQWILSELIRLTAGLPLEQACRLVDEVNLPLRDLVQDVGSRRIVLEDLPADEEILILMHSWHPNVTRTKDILAALHRCARSTVFNALKRLEQRKFVEKVGRGEWVLTYRGLNEAASLVKRCLERQE